MYSLTIIFFDKISQTKMGFNGVIQLRDTLSKLDEVYGVKFEGKGFDIETHIKWLKLSLTFANV